MVKDRRGGGGSLSSLAHAGLIKIAQGARGTRTMNPADSIEGAEFRDLLTSYVDIGIYLLTICRTRSNQPHCCPHWQTGIHAQTVRGVAVTRRFVLGWRFIGGVFMSRTHDNLKS